MIPTYGQEDVILDALDSALAQDYQNLEIIVADDASPDHTAELVATRKDSRLHYHRNPYNVGRVANYRNTLYNLANGEWVINLDGDDYYTNTRFISEAVKLAFADPNIVIVAANCQIIVDGQKSPLYVRPIVKVLPGIEVVSNVYDHRYHYFHMSTLYHRPTALSLNFYRSDVISSDWESLYRLSLCGKVAFMNSVAGVWRVSGSNASMSCDWRSAAANLSIWHSIFSDAMKLSHQYQRVFIAKQRILFSAAYLQLFKLIRSRISFASLSKYLFAIGQYAGIMTLILILMYYKSIFWLFIRLIQSVRSQVES